MSQSTIVERKQQFLRQQKQILSKGIAPSNKVLAIADRAGIQAKIIGDVMLKVNRDLRRHGRLVYSRQMTDHVLEQIDLLYWEAGAPALETNNDPSNEDSVEANDAIYQGIDLTLDKHIAKLRPTWDTSSDPPATTNDLENEVTQESYMTSISRLQDLSAKRLLLRQKLSTYQTLLALLEPYRNPQENIQPNLVSRDAPIAMDLTKARTLAIRVAGRVSEKYGDLQIPTTAEEEDGEEHDGSIIEDDGNAKLEEILKSW